MIRWNDGLNLDIPILDNEHKNLLYIINKLSTIEFTQEQMKSLEAILNELLSALKEHALHEETLLKESGYDQIDKHSEDHSDLINKIRSLKADTITSGEFVDIETMHKDLLELLLMHIVNESVPLRKAFKNSNNSQEHANKSILKNIITKTTNIFSFTKRILLSALIPLIGMMILGMIVLWHNYDKYDRVKVTYHGKSELS